MAICLSENTVVDVLQRGLSQTDEAHLAECERCRELVQMLSAAHAVTNIAHRTADEGAAPVEPFDVPPEVPLVGPGDRVGRYVIERCIGAGGMGAVYAARDPELDRDVAIKVINPGVGAAAEILEQRMVRESRAMAQLAHPNVLAVYDVGRTQGHVFIAMELARGGTLADWLADERRTWREVAARFCLAGRGLHAAHEVGLVHRDFKPENVLLTAEGGVRVADFGLVVSDMDAVAQPVSPATPDRETDPDRLASTQTAVALLTRTGLVLGTPYYMAPEQHDGKKAGPPADQFAFAVALWEGFYCERPFGGTTYSELAGEVKAGRLRAVPGGNDVPPAVHQVLVRALAVEPQERWPSMAALIETLERHIASRSALPEPTDPKVRAEVRALRRRLAEAELLGGAGRYAEGVGDAAAVVAESAALGHVPLHAEALYCLGCLEEQAGDHAAAERTLNAAVVEASRARDDGLAAQIWCDLLRVIGLRAGRPADAMLLRPAAEAALARCVDDPVVQGRFYNTQGVVSDAHGNSEEALVYYERALDLWTRALGPRDLLVARALNNLGRALMFLGRFAEAAAHHRRAFDIYRATLESDHPLVAISLNNVGELLFDEGRHEDARVMHERALAIRARRLPSDHPFTALSLYNLGAALDQLGRCEEARDHVERALVIRQTALGADHPDVGESLALLAHVLERLGDHDGAARHRERARVVLDKALRPGHSRWVRVRKLLEGHVDSH